MDQLEYKNSLSQALWAMQGKEKKKRRGIGNFFHTRESNPVLRGECGMLASTSV